VIYSSFGLIVDASTPDHLIISSFITMIDFLMNDEEMMEIMKRRGGASLISGLLNSFIEPCERAVLLDMAGLLPPLHTNI